MANETFKIHLTDPEGVLLAYWKVTDEFDWEEDEMEVLFTESSLRGASRQHVIRSVGEEIIHEVEIAMKARSGEGK